MPVSIARRAFAMWLLCLPITGQSQPTDRDQAIYIEADSAVLMEKKGFSEYTGNVVIRQGALEMHGDNMTVYNSENNIDRIILTGSPATIVQHPEGDGEDLHAEAGKMEYRAAEEHIILTGAARIWQTDGKEFRSEKIIYNVKTRTVNAGDSATGDRVHITLQPKKKPDDNGKPESK